MKIKRKILFFSLSIVLAFTLNASGEMKTMTEKTVVEYLSKGIQHINTTKNTFDGPVEIDVLKIDLDNKYTDLKPVYSKELSKRDKLTNIANEWSATGAINGDFFNMSYPSFTYGTLMDGDDIISSPNSGAYNYPTIVKDGSDFDISIIEPSMTIEVDKEKLTVAAVNKIGAFNNEIVILNSAWGEESIGSNDERYLAEIVVSRNKVKSINIGHEPVDIPSSGYVIVFNADNKEILDKFERNDRVSIDVDFGFDIDDIDWASGGVNYLLRNGEEGDYNNDVLGRHPRTAIGFTEDEKTAYLITVDGRSESSIGMLQSELVEFMIDLGCWNGVNLDGGGSSEMVVDRYGKKESTVVNNPSDGRERLIVSGLGVFNDYPRNTKVKTIEAVDINEKYFKGQYLSFEIKAYNKYKVPIKFSESRLKIKVSGLDYKKDRNGIKFMESGRAEVKVSYGSESCKFKVQVLGDVKEIYSQIEGLSLDENSEYQLPEFVAIDDNGNTLEIKASEMEWSLSERIADIEDGIVESRSKSGKAVMKGTFDEGEIYIPLIVGSYEKLLNGFENLDNISLKEYPDDSNGRIKISSKNREGRKSLKLYYDFTTMKPDDQSIAFIEFGQNGFVVEDKPDSLSMWVYGDRSNHWLRCRITDANGIMHKIDFEEEIDWRGWKEVSAYLPENISYPIAINNIYIAEIYNENADEGYIYVDGLKAHYPLGYDDINIPESSLVEDLLMDIPEKYDSKLMVSETLLSENYNLDYSMTDDKGNAIDVYEDLALIEIHTLNKSISEYDKFQWENLLDLKEYEDKTIIIKTDIYYYDINEGERKTLKNYFDLLNENNSIFIISSDKELNDVGIKYDDGMRFIKYNEYFSLYMIDGEKRYDYK